MTSRPGLYCFAALCCTIAVAAFLVLFVALFIDCTRSPILWMSTPHFAPVSKTRTRFVLRTLNVHFLLQSFPRFGETILDGVDVVVMQEAFRKPHAIVKMEAVQKIVQLAAAKRLQVSVSTTFEEPASLPKIVDSGLACVGLRGNDVRFVAFRPFCVKGMQADILSNKGVAVFDVNKGQLRIATTHFQASYNSSESRNKKQKRIRLRQFHEAVRFCRSHHVDVLAGDFNTSFPNEIENMFASCGLHPFQLCKPKYQTTAAKNGVDTKQWDLNPSEYGQTIDYFVILRPERVTALAPATARREVSRPWSDHAAVDLEIEIVA